MKRTLFPIFGLVTLAACNPQADAYPDLLPTAQILAEPTLPDHSAEAVASPEAVDAQAGARADALRRRAEALKKPVIEPSIRARMQQNQ